MTGTIATTVDSAKRGFNFRTGRELPTLRRDLQITRHSFQKRCSYVVKDSASLKYFRWGEREYHLGRLLNGEHTFQEIVQKMKEAFPDHHLDDKTIENTINQFLLTGLLSTDATTALRIYQRERKGKEKAARKAFLFSLLSKIISFKITLFDPDLLLLRLSESLRFLWTWPAVILLLCMMAGSGYLILSDTSTLPSRTPDLLGWDNLFILWIVMILVKVVHEFGHGLACKHFGGEVHEMGAMFILFSPFLFCNATDSWTFTNKRQRLIVTFGGIYLELFLASIAAALWVLTVPGLFNQICFNVMMVCSVMTIFFNANPLMKFDGYYALSDIIEVPNLKERGDRALISRVAGIFTAGVGVVKDPLVDRLKLLILTYAIASYLWTFGIAFRMLGAIGTMLQPYGLDRVAQMGAGLVLLAGIVAPPLMVGFHLRKLIVSHDDPEFRKKVYLRLLIGLILLILILCVPIPQRVRSTCVLDGSNRTRVTALTSGYLRSIMAQDGHHVSKDAPLATLENRELEAALQDITLNLNSAQSQEDAALSLPSSPNISAARALKSEAESALHKFQLDKKGLIISAPISGTVIMMTNPERTIGSLLRYGELFCEILPDGPLQAIVGLTELEAALVKPGQHAEFRLNSYSGVTFIGKVLEVSQEPLNEFPHQSLSQYAGGTVPSVMTASRDSSTPHAMPAGPLYRARIAIDNPEGILRLGMSGRIRIQCGNKPLGAMLWNNLTVMIRTDFKL